MGNMWEVGRDLEGTEPTEYWERRFLDACDIGRCRVLRREEGEVMSGGRAGWFGFGEEATTRGDAAGEEVFDITAVVVMPYKADGATVVRSGAHGRLAAK